MTIFSHFNRVQMILLVLLHTFRLTPLRPMRVGIVLSCSFIVAIAFAAPNEKEVTLYSELRWKLFEQPTFNPYTAHAVEKALTDECMTLWRGGKGQEAITKCKEALTAFPASILANRMLADIFQTYATSASATETQQKQLRSIESEYRSSAEGLIQSVLSSGDGETPDSAYRVITIGEEYMIPWYLGLSRIQQDVVSEAQKKFDALLVRDGNGKEKTIYFDVTPFAKKFGL